jgi:hypothetical protein
MALSGGNVWAGLGAAAAVGGVSAFDASHTADENTAERRATGGLTEREFSKLAAAAMEQGIAWNNRAGMEQVYTDLGFKGDFSKVYENILSLGENFTKLGASAMAATLAQESYAQSVAESIAQNNEAIKDSDFYD